MKNSFVKLFSIAVLFAAFTLITSCGSDDPDSIDITPPVADVISGLQNGVMSGTLEENFTLDASTQYSLTGQFIIADGASLTIPAGTRIIATAGGTEVYIAVLQGAQIFINGNASNPVVMSSATGSAGDWGGLTICGKATTTAGVDAVAEVGGFIYGGTSDTDSSGNINFLQIVGTGAQINPESQYNGVSFYGVGSGTVVNNIAVINGADDGVEFFGGTVNASYLYLENNDDDSVDWTEGWNGSINNVFITHTNAGFSTAFEADGANGNPTFSNVTAISTQGGIALQFKKQSGATITGLSLSGYDVSIDMKDDGSLTNVQIEGVDADPNLNYTATPTVSASDFPWVDTNLTFDSNILQGTVTGTVTLDANITYKLNSSYIIENGGKLIIPAGTKIEARAGGTGVYIAVLIGGEIDIQGTAANPVVMSSVDANGGDWGGLTICGKATTTAGANAVAEVGGFVYGGTTDDDSSGSIRYLVIKGTGAQINSESQYNGVSFYGVGSGTTVEYISVVNGADDGVEFFGGTVNASNLYLENNDDDSIDWTEGWNGTVTNAYISHTVAGFSTAFEGDGANGNPIFNNITAISTQNGIGLQFKKQSGATITNLWLEGYAQIIDMKDDGALSNVQIEGADADPQATYQLNRLDITGWTWRNAGL
tara:strand:+ start:5546 stop:7510 length:1965 start_codon:yes stop_codon:yes gene_type:complete